MQQFSGLLQRYVTAAYELICGSGGFHVDSLDNEVRSDRVIRSNLARQYIAYLKFLVFYVFFIIKCKPIFFAINLNIVSLYKVFDTFDYVFLSIVLFT